MTRAPLSLHSRLALAFGALMFVVVGTALLLWMWSSNNYERSPKHTSWDPKDR